MQYQSNKKVFGLKIDLRFVVTLTNIDMDIGALEAANELPTNKKILHDAGKLFVETKDIVDGLLNNIHDITDVREISGAGIQVGGNMITIVFFLFLSSSLSDLLLTFRFGRLYVEFSFRQLYFFFQNIL